jgi:hypothetical protein
MIRDLDQQIRELELEERKYNTEICKIQLGMEPNYKELDLLGSKQEILRRGIEVCASVLKLGSAVSLATKNIADDKMQEFLKSLKTN